MHTTLSRVAPVGSTKLDTDPRVDAYIYKIASGFVAMVYAGRSVRPTFHYRYKDEDSARRAALNYVKVYCEARDARDSAIKARRAERTQPHTLNIGDILYCMWGYDQTNVDFIQVTKLIGKTMVEYRHIRESVTSEYPGTDSVLPIKDGFVPDTGYRGGTHKARVDGSSNSIRLYSFASASPWDGKPKHQTAFGWGH